MKTTLRIVILASAAIWMLACNPPAANTPPTNANTGNTNAAPKAAAPTKEALVAMENKAFDAWKNKDGKFFEGFLTDNFVMFDGKGNHLDKAATVKMIGEHKCDLKSFSFSDEKMTMAGADAAIVTMKVTSDGTCGGQKMPSPVISASVYVRSGDTWKGAYHNEVPVVDPKNMKADASKPAPPAKKDETAGKKDAADSGAITDQLVALEKKGWEAWKAGDTKTLDEITHKDLMFVNLFGNVYATKADTIKAWTEPKCDVKSYSVTDGHGVSLTKDASILLFKGSAEGTCGDAKLSSLWGTSIFVKEGETWKLAYMFETPA